MKPTNSRPASFISRLSRWKNDRGALANLRCALRSEPGLRRRAWPLIAQLTSLTNEGGYEDSMLVVYETVAGLWAADPDSHQRVDNFGTTCRQLRGDHESFDSRFRRLLNCYDRAELCERLVPITLAAQAKGIPVNYDVLFKDLSYFAGDGRDRVCIRWAQEYWGNRPEAEEGAAEPTAGQ